MTFSALILSSIDTIGLLLAAMALVALIETALPLRQRNRWNRAHLAPNLTLTLITFATNAFFNSALVLALVSMEGSGFGILPQLGLPPLVSATIAVLMLDFSFYLAHVGMHHIPGWWRVHRVHHTDPTLDVTTTVRQHPIEGVIRYAFMATAAVALGATPAAFAVYRTWSALNGLLEHANLRMPRRLDSLLSSVLVTPNMHKVHHSRRASESDTNFSNIFALFDRMFRTFTPSLRGIDIAYGLEGYDDPAQLTTTALLALPFQPAQRPAAGRIATLAQVATAVPER